MFRMAILPAITVVLLSLQNIPQLKVDVEVVLVPATVTNGVGRYVTDLRKEHFRIWEDGVEQKITQFSTEDAPMTLGIAVDTSGSMKAILDAARTTSARCLDVGLADDEYFLVLFSSKAELASDITTDFSSLRLPLMSVKSKGSTALYDAIHMGLEKLKQGTNARKALVVISDGYENNSRYRAGTVKNLVRESDMQVFSIGNEGDGALKEMTELTGGRQFRMGSVLGSCGLITQELKYQYLLAYQSTNPAKDGKWRNIQVKMNPPPSLRELTVRAKKGYTAEDSR
jgi:Ca-activated chloride channel family protein